MRDLTQLCWTSSQLGKCIAALARKAGLIDTEIQASSGLSADTDSSMEWHAKRLGCEAERIETTFAELETALRAAPPALLQVEESQFLAILNSSGAWLRILTPDLKTVLLPLNEVLHPLRTAVEPPNRAEYERLVSETRLPHSKQARVVELLLAEQIGSKRFEKCWTVRVSPGARPGRWLGQASTGQKIAGLLAAHSAQYGLWIASWAILGRLSFEGRLDRGWLLVWALVLLGLVPFRVLTTWLQGLLAIGVGRILKRRLLWGALRLEPDEVRHQGIGSFLGQALEAEAVETLALSGGIAGLLACIELVVSGFILGRLAVVLVAWMMFTAACVWRYFGRYRRWTEARMRVTHDLIESMVGHRTRLAQQRRDLWHHSEDQELDSYIHASRAVDKAATLLIGLAPRGWLIAGLACLASLISRDHASGAHIAVVLGGILLAYNAFRRLTASFVDVASATVAWQRISPLFHAASRPEHLPSRLSEEAKDNSENVIVAEGLIYTYPGQRSPALRDAGLVIGRSERVLLEGSSGGGKSTFASVLAGLRRPDSGLLLLNGHEREVLGDDRWRKQIIAAPQFHDNHILTETLAFNVLMGRGWPPSPQDLEEAEEICRELGLGDLLERMPAGIMQMVGEGGWQLSHGERSRVYIARTLLQNPDLVILDESFAALDPENLKGALECTLRHAPTLMVIAHP